MERMNETGLHCKQEELSEAVGELTDFIQRMATDGGAAHEVEKDIWRRVLSMGHQALGMFFRLQGDGDLGAEVELADGRRLRRLPRLHQRAYQSVFGAFELERAVYGQREGQKIEYVPLDTRLRLPEGKFSYLLQEWDQALVVETAYAQVNTTLARILGFSQSVDSLERMNRKMATAVPDFCEHSPVPPDAEEGEIVVSSADGKGVPIRCPADCAPIDAHQPKSGPKPNRKKMAVLGTVYTIDRCPRTPEDVVESLFRDPAEPRGAHAPRPKPKHKRIRASLARSPTDAAQPSTEEIFGWMARESEQRNRLQDKPLAVLMDGQETLWQASEQHLSSKIQVQILDLLHVTPRLWKAAYLFHPKGSDGAIGFVRERVLRVLRGEARSVVRGLRSMSTAHAPGSKKREKVRRICAYFEKNYSRMRYDEYLAAGYPIATGVIEGACRHLVKDRMERAGMRWVLCGAQSMLHLRSIHISGQWDEFTAYRIRREIQKLHPHAQLTESIEWPIAA